MKTKKQISNKIQIVTLGCSKTVDSENLITQLKYNQFEVEHNPIKEVSQTVVINTCGFIDRAKEESINTILEYANLKSKVNWRSCMSPVVCPNDIKTIWRKKFLKWMHFWDHGNAGLACEIKC